MIREKLKQQICQLAAGRRNQRVLVAQHSKQRQEHLARAVVAKGAVAPNNCQQLLDCVAVAAVACLQRGELVARIDVAGLVATSAGAGMDAAAGSSRAVGFALSSTRTR